MNGLRRVSDMGGSFGGGGTGLPFVLLAPCFGAGEKLAVPVGAFKVAPFRAGEHALAVIHEAAVSFTVEFVLVVIDIIEVVVVVRAHSLPSITSGFRLGTRKALAMPIAS